MLAVSDQARSTVVAPKPTVLATSTMVTDSSVMVDAQGEGESSSGDVLVAEMSNDTDNELVQVNAVNSPEASTRQEQATTAMSELADAEGALAEDALMADNGESVALVEDADTAQDAESGMESDNGLQSADSDALLDKVSGDPVDLDIDTTADAGDVEDAGDVVDLEKELSEVEDLSVADKTESQSDKPTIVVPLELGETLWSFSRRTTGTGTNWQAIADLNEIENVKTIFAGKELKVPMELALFAVRQK